MLFMVFIGTYLITMNNDRNFFVMQQMESNAQDTATSLGLSLLNLYSVMIYYDEFDGSSSV